MRERNHRAAGWVAATAGIFLLQLLLIFWLSRGERHPQPGETMGAVLSLASGEVVDTLPVHRPDLLSRFHREGASGALWEGIHEPEEGHVPWSEAPRYYGGAEAWIGGGLGTAVPGAEAPPVPPSIVSRPSHHLQESERPAEVPARSHLVVEGELSASLPGGLPPLRTFAHPGRLRPTTISVAADRFGWPLSAAILANSIPRERWISDELPEPDAFALEWVRSLRFLPAGEASGEPRWGTFTFHWALAEPRSGS